MGLVLPGSDSQSANSESKTCSDPASKSDPICEDISGLQNGLYADAASPHRSIDWLQRKFSHMDCTDSQRCRMNEFFKAKEAIGEINVDSLEDLYELGHGTSGIVLKVRHRPTGQVMARKMIHLEVKPLIRQQIIRELSVLHLCNSPYIVGSYGAFIHNGEINMCMEYMDGGSLDIMLKQVPRLPENILGCVTVSVLEGLNYLREKHRIIHRDVKPSNILVNSQGEVKLCDFGVSGQLIDSMANTFIGTRSYMAPERLDGSRYTVQSDIWSLGLSLVELALGRYPIPYPSDAYVTYVMSQDPLSERCDDFEPQMPMAIFELLAHIFEGSPPSLPREHFTHEFCDFVDVCLRRKSSERKDLLSLLQSSFANTYRSCELNNVADWVSRVHEMKMKKGNETSKS